MSSDYARNYQCQPLPVNGPAPWVSLTLPALPPFRGVTKPVTVLRKVSCSHGLIWPTPWSQRNGPCHAALGAIWTPQDWHEMVSACAGLSCMTSHGVCLCHSFSALKSPSNWSGLAERTSNGSWFCPLDAARFEDVVASNNTECHRLALVGSARWFVPPAEPWMASPYRLIHCRISNQDAADSETLVVRM